MIMLPQLIQYEMMNECDIGFCSKVMDSMRVKVMKHKL